MNKLIDLSASGLMEYFAQGFSSSNGPGDDTDALDDVLIDGVYSLKELADAIAASMLKARQDALGAAVNKAMEYVWDEHELAQSTPIGRACHHQASEIVTALRSLSQPQKAEQE